MSLAARLERAFGSEVVGVLEHPDIAGSVPLVAPADEAMLVEVLRFAAREKLKVLPLGAGSKLSWTRPPERVDMALSTRRLSGVTAYEPGDGTISARAGTTLEELRAITRAKGHHFTPDIARPGSATLGGVLAAAQCGLDRTRNGPVRNHVLGMRVALSDGRITKTGGRLVKNVTGFDLHRLYCGSHGSLCVILEASMRLFAGSELELAIECDMPDVGTAMAKLRPLARLGVAPYCVHLESREHGPRTWLLHVLLAGRADTVAWERTAVLDALSEARVVDAADTAARFARLREHETWTGTLPLLRLASVPSLASSIVARVDAWAREHALSPAFMLEPTTGLCDVILTPKDDRARDLTDRSIQSFATGMRDLASDRVDVRVLGGPPEYRRAADPWTVAPPVLRLMQALRRALDSGGVLASGRLHPEL